MPKKHGDFIAPDYTDGIMMHKMTITKLRVLSMSAFVPAVSLWNEFSRCFACGTIVDMPWCLAIHFDFQVFYTSNSKGYIDCVSATGLVRKVAGQPTPPLVATVINTYSRFSGFMMDHDGSIPLYPAKKFNFVERDQTTRIHQDYHQWLLGASSGQRFATSKVEGVACV